MIFFRYWVSVAVALGIIGISAAGAASPSRWISARSSSALAINPFR
jgi:hypothetical protein